MDETVSNFFTKRDIIILGVIITAFVIVCYLSCYFIRKIKPISFVDRTHIPPGEYVTEQGSEKMTVDTNTVRIIRGKATLYLLPNKTSIRVYSNDDLAKTKPQRLCLVGDDKVEWIREPAGPCPEYKMIFSKRESK